jgi:mycothiol synthase
MKLRAPTIEDVPEITAAMNDVAQWLHGRNEASEDEVRLWFEAPEFEPERDAVLALADNGAIAAYGDVSDPSREGRLIWLDVYVRPGITEAVADALLDELEARAEARLGPGGRLKAFVDERDSVLAGLLAARGYHIDRHSFRMEADLTREPAEPVWPEGVSVRTFRPGEDDRRVYEVQEETFADQLDHEDSSYEEWRHWSFREPFDADLWFLAEEGEELAGILLARGERGGDYTLGWVSVLGVRRPWRRRGLGRALLLHAFRELRARGKPRAGLGVDGANTTGAVDLYRQAGMQVVRQFDHWERSSQS